MKNQKFKPTEIFNMIEIPEYENNLIVIKTIFRKKTGDICAISFDNNKTLKAENSPFDTFIQVIDGKAVVLINNKSSIIETGQYIIIPANSSSTITANEKFKILVTTIKKGYNDERDRLKYFIS